MGRTLEEIQAEADAVTDDSLQATRRMVAMAAETEQVGAKTLEDLDAQGEQLRRVDQGMDKINSDVKGAEQHLTNMEKCCGLCLCPCNRSQNFESNSWYDKVWKKRTPGSEGAAAKVISEQPGVESRRGAANRTSEPSGDYVARITGDAREDEMNENIGQVHSILGNLKAQAHAMSDELDAQDVVIDRIGAKTSSNTARVKNANERTTKLLA